MILKTDIRIQWIKKVTEELIRAQPLHIRVKMFSPSRFRSTRRQECFHSIFSELGFVNYQISNRFMHNVEK